MVCPKCGQILSDRNASICEYCGAILSRGSAEKPSLADVRQGRSASSAPAERPGSAFPMTKPADDMADRTISERRRARYRPDMKKAQAAGKDKKAVRTRRSSINWAKIALYLFIAFILIVITGWVLLQTTLQGQLILARLGRETSAEALWIYGKELMDEGYIEKSIATYEKAYKQDPNIENLYEYLKELALAYEAAGRDGDAETIFTKMCELDPKNSYAYEKIVNLMIKQDRKPAAAELLEKAYKNTGKTAFNTQRSELLPITPTASLGGGKYSSAKTLELESPEGYKIIYLFGQGNLPEDGTEYLGPITLGEGYWALKAVCVSSELVSDELNVNYTITLPAPQAPYFNLASNTYNSAAVKIRNLNDFPVTIYYTIDGTTPTANSPIYDGTPIVLPRGRSVHLKAVCVDASGKVSNERDVEYEILGGELKKYFREDDSFSGFTLMNTKRDAFEKKYGSREAVEIEDGAIRDKCISVTYDWGSARFYSSEKGYTLYYVETTSSSMVGPRSTKVGMSRESVLNAFRDMGQAKNQDGSRSIYYDNLEGCYASETAVRDGKSRIDYSYERDDDATVTLSYELENNTVVKISILCSYQDKQGDRHVHIAE